MIEMNNTSSDWPRISIVTPSLNQAPFLEATIKSVLSQGYPNLQYGIVDGGSTDGSLEIIDRYRDQLDYVVVESDRGQSDAINKGFARADGDVIGWLCSDDVYTPGALAAVGEVFRGDPATQWIVGHCRHVDTEGQPLDPALARGASPECTLADLLLGRGGVCFPQPGSFWSRSLMQKVGPLDESLHYQMDYDLWCRFLASGVGPVLLDRELAYYRLHELSKTCSAQPRFMQERIRLRSRYAPRLSLGDRVKLTRLLGYLKRAHAIETCEVGLWKQVFRRPWWLASGQVRAALREGGRRAA